MTYPQYPPHQPARRPGLSTGAKVTLGCGTAAVGSFFVLVIFGMVSVLATPPEPPPEEVTGASTEEQPREEEPETEAEEEDAPGMSETVEHGDFAFTITNVEEGITSVDTGIVGPAEPRGQYVVVSITAENISDSGAYFEGSDQVLIDVEGAVYSYDIEASEGFDWLEKINPGTEVSGTLAYDVPEGFEVSHMMVNGKSMFDEGVRVDLG